MVGLLPALPARGLPWTPRASPAAGVAAAPLSCETRGLGRPRNLGWDPHVPTCDFGQYPNFLGPGALSLEMRLISPARAITESEKENGQDAPGQSSVPSESHATVT